MEIEGNKCRKKTMMLWHLYSFFNDMSRKHAPCQHRGRYIYAGGKKNTPKAFLNESMCPNVPAALNFDMCVLRLFLFFFCSIQVILLSRCAVVQLFWCRSRGFPSHFSYSVYFIWLWLWHCLFCYWSLYIDFRSPFPFVANMHVGVAGNALNDNG